MQRLHHRAPRRLRVEKAPRRRVHPALQALPAEAEEAEEGAERGLGPAVALLQEEVEVRGHDGAAHEAGRQQDGVAGRQGTAAARLAAREGQQLGRGRGHSRLAVVAWLCLFGSGRVG